MFYDLFYDLCTQKKVTPSKACLDMGLSRSLAAKWKNTNATPSADVIAKIAAYFDVSTDYLFERHYPSNVEVFNKKTGEWVPVEQHGGSEQKKEAPAKAEALSVEERVDEILAGMESEQTLMLDGNPMSPEAMETLRNALTIGVEMARKINKEKRMANEEERDR